MSSDESGAGRYVDSVGATLRAERERRGWDIGEIAQQLKIRRVHLEAIEDERFDLVPAGTYAVNFVRTYSEALGLDAVEMVRRYREALTGGDRRLELHFPQPLPESKLPGGIILLVSIAIAALAYGAWLVLNQGVRETLARVDPVPQQLQQAIAPPPAPPAPPISTSTATPPSSSAPETRSSPDAPSAAAPTVDSSQAATPVAPPIAATPPAAVPSPVVAPVPPVPPAPPAPAPALAVVAAPAATTSVPAGGPPAPPQLGALAPSPAPQPPQVTETAQGTRVFGDGAAASRIQITAQADSWVQVREATGATIFMRILKAGDVYQVPNRPGLLLTTGSAGSIELKVDGKVAPSLGNKGFVRRDVPLEPERLLAGSGGDQPVRPPQAAPARSGG